VAAIVQAKSSAIPGTQAYLKAYWGGLNELCEDLTEEEQEAMMEKAKEWNEKAAPPDLQVK
jgi:hypothetical protein